MHPWVQNTFRWPRAYRDEAFKALGRPVPRTRADSSDPGLPFLLYCGIKDAPCLRRKNVFRKKAPGKKKYVRGKRDHTLTAPGRTVWVVRTGRRGEEEVERGCSDRHETCTLYLQLLEPYHLKNFRTAFGAPWYRTCNAWPFQGSFGGICPSVASAVPRSAKSGGSLRRDCRAPKVARSKCKSRGDRSKPARLLPNRVSSSHHPHRPPGSGQFMGSFPRTYFFLPDTFSRKTFSDRLRTPPLKPHFSNSRRITTAPRDNQGGEFFEPS